MNHRLLCHRLAYKTNTGYAFLDWISAASFNNNTNKPIHPVKSVRDRF